MIKKISITIFLLLFIIINFTAAQEIKIVHFSDVHLDTINKSRQVRKFEESLPMFQKAIKKVNNLYPDIVVFSGDMVNRSIESEFVTFLNTANKLNSNYYTVFGNHDVGVGGGMSKQRLLTLLNTNCTWLHQQKPYYYVIKKDYIFIFGDGTNDKIITANGYFDDNFLSFLDETLSQHSDKYAIIVQHFPLIPPYKSISHEIINKNKYFEVLDKHDNVIMVLSGHYHASKTVERNNVLYISTPSLIEYPHAFRYLTVNTNSENVIIKSTLYPDSEQNLSEGANPKNGHLKLGRNEDNFYTIKLKNNLANKHNLHLSVFH